MNLVGNLEESLRLYRNSWKKVKIYFQLMIHTFSKSVSIDGEGVGEREHVG